MSTAGHETWRVILFARGPIGPFYQRLDSTLTEMGHRLVGVVTSPGPKSRRSNAYLDLVAQTRPGVDIIVSDYPNRWAAMLAPLRPDLIIVTGFSWRLPQDVLDLPRLGSINGHNALLPKYRGRGDYITAWAFRNDDGELGFTIHRMTAEFDNGPILAQGSIPIGDDDDLGSLLPGFIDLYFDLLPRAFERIANGDPGDPQNEEEATYSTVFEEEWRKIDWNDSARAIHNKVRSWPSVGDNTPYPRTALGVINGVERQILKTRLVKDNPATAALPGTILEDNGDTMLIQCGDGPLQILRYE
jgi:methionyl-tRNA formyltransferase